MQRPRVSGPAASPSGSPLVSRATNQTRSGRAVGAQSGEGSTDPGRLLVSPGNGAVLIAPDNPSVTSSIQDALPHGPPPFSRGHLTAPSPWVISRVRRGDRTESWPEELSLVGGQASRGEGGAPGPGARRANAHALRELPEPQRHPRQAEASQEHSHMASVSSPSGHRRFFLVPQMVSVLGWMPTWALVGTSWPAHRCGRLRGQHRGWRGGNVSEELTEILTGFRFIADMSN